VVASLQKAEREAATETLLLLAAQQAAAPVGASSGHMAARETVTVGGASYQPLNWSTTEAQQGQANLTMLHWLTDYNRRSS
jgi:hypothetical protein